MKLSAITTTAGASGGGGDGVDLRSGNIFGQGMTLGYTSTSVSCSANTWTSLLNLTGPGVLFWVQMSSSDANTVNHDLRLIVDGVEVASGTTAVGTFNWTPFQITVNHPFPVIKYNTSLVLEYRSTKTHSVSIWRQALGVK